MKKILGFRTTFATFIASSLGFVTALSWSNAIRSTLDVFLSQENILIYKFLSAIIITIITILAIFLIKRNKQ
jgi:hypothetical protein